LLVREQSKQQLSQLLSNITRKARLIISRAFQMVEVAGIEPASENLSRQASTCIVRVLINRQDLPRTGYITG